tara:strand:- start:382 stop:864 length:483 start_codon:yes stop_codon:yes gene_type:complete
MTTFDYNNSIYSEYLENDANWGDDMVNDDEKDTITYAERERLAEQHRYNQQQYVRDAPIQTISVSASTDDEGKVIHFNKFKWYNTKMGTDDHKMFIGSGWAGSRVWFENVEHMRKYYKYVHNTDLTLDPDYLNKLDNDVKTYRAMVERNEPHKLKVRNVL